jgi:hypothetical protein
MDYLSNNDILLALENVLPASWITILISTCKGLHKKFSRKYNSINVNTIAINKNMVSWCVSNGFLQKPMGHAKLIWATISHDLDALKYICRKIPYNFNTDACICAAKAQKYDILDYLVRFHSVVLTKQVSYWLVVYGQIDILLGYIGNCSIRRRDVDPIAQSAFLSCGYVDDFEVIAYASGYCDMDALQLLIANDYVPIIKRLLRKNLIINSRYLAEIVLKSHNLVVFELFARWFNWNGELLNEAIVLPEMPLEMISAAQNRLDPDKVAVYAAQNANSHILEWLKSRGLKLKTGLYDAAMENKYLGEGAKCYIVHWLYENKIPIIDHNKQLIQPADKLGHIKVLVYLRSVGIL